MTLNDTLNRTLQTALFQAAAPAHRARPSRQIGLAGVLELARQRRALAKLDATRLADLGLGPAEARREATRPAWDVPSHWLR